MVQELSSFESPTASRVITLAQRGENLTIDPSAALLGILGYHFIINICFKEISHPSLPRIEMSPPPEVDGSAVEHK